MVAAYAAVIVAVAQTSNEGPMAILVVAVASVVLVGVGYLRGPKPRWRWGRRPEDSPSEDW